MTRSIPGAVAIALLAATLAQAQSGQQAPAEGGDNAPVPTDMPAMSMDNWTEASIATFFADQALRELRVQEDIRSSWVGLSQDERDQVRSDCAPLADADAGAGGAGDATGSATTDPAGSTDLSATRGTSTEPGPAANASDGTGPTAGTGASSGPGAPGQGAAGMQTGDQTADDNTQTDPAALSAKHLPQQMWMDLCTIVELL